MSKTRGSKKKSRRYIDPRTGARFVFGDLGARLMTIYQIQNKQSPQEFQREEEFKLNFPANSRFTTESEEEERLRKMH